MIKAPIFDTLKDNDSTLYFFSESNNDLLDNLTSQTTKRVPSKFACIKLPDWQNLSGAARQLFLDPAVFSSSPVISDPNQLVPALLQNYIENGVAIAKTENVFEPEFTEHMLWKMLQTAGSFDPAISGTSYVDNWGDGLVQYVGDINLLNHAEYKDEEYSEMYIQVPHDARRVINSTWSSLSTMSGLTTIPVAGNGDSVTQGLTDSAITLKNAIYDFTGGSMTDEYDFSNAADRLVLDLETQETVEEGFDYNAILIWYDVFDVSDPSVKTRKLGGILFVDDFIEQGASGTWTLQSFTKSFNTLNTTGNALAHRVNTRFFYGNNTVDALTVVNQFNTISMDLYTEALAQMMTINGKYESNLAVIDNINAKLANLAALTDSISQIDSLQTQLTNITNTVNDITAGTTASTQITTQQLLESFDNLVEQLLLYNSNPAGGTFNNTFVFESTIASDVTAEESTHVGDFIATSSGDTYSVGSILVVTQAEYDALATPDPDTVYLIV